MLRSLFVVAVLLPGLAGAAEEKTAVDLTWGARIPLRAPGEIHRYAFDGFYFFSRRITEGSRLRFVVSSPNSIYAQKNYNGGGVVAKESGADARTAHVKVHHDEKNPSFIGLPVVQ